MLAAALLFFTLLSGCGGGGGSGPVAPAPPPTPAPITFQIIFPGEVSLTDANQIAVVGTADASRLASVVVTNGSSDIVANQDSAGVWRASGIPLAPGDNQLSVRLTENNGQVTELPVSTVRSSPILSYPTAVLFDSLNQRVVILDPKQLLSFDLVSNELVTLSAAGVGMGPNFGVLRHFALDTDGAIIVASLRNIQRVDPISGDRSDYVVLPADAGPISTIAVDQQLARLFAVGFFGDLYTADLSLAPPISATTLRALPPVGLSGGGPLDGVFVPVTSAVYAVDFSGIDVTEIDAATGNASSIPLNFGSFATTPIGIDYDTANLRLLVLGNSGAVLSLDPVTQVSALLFPPPPASNPPVSLRGLNNGNDKLWTVAPVPGELRSIDKTTGDQLLVASSRVGGGVPPGPMLAGRFDANSQRFVAIAGSRIIAVDLETGSRELLAELNSTTQSTPVLATGLALSQDGTRAWLPDIVSQKIVQVDLNSGVLTTVSGPAIGAGPLPVQISGIAINAENDVAYVADRFAQRIIRIDLTNGQRSELTSLPTELQQSEIRSLVLDSVANRLLLNIAPISPASNDEPSIYALNLVSLETTFIASLATVESPRTESTAPGSSFMQMSLSADGQSLYTPVSGNIDIPFARIDLGTGVVASLGTAISGVPFFVPNAIEALPSKRILALDGSGALLILSPGTGERSIISK